MRRSNGNWGMVLDADKYIHKTKPRVYICDVSRYNKKTLSTEITVVLQCTVEYGKSFVRGEDTRKSFTDHLYTALVRQGFVTFRDDDEAEKCENLKSELEKAIRYSKSSILVLSKNYASSSWCLDELVMILDKKKNSELNHLHDLKHQKHAVLPVFYDVKPSHLRKQTGMVAESFIGYEKQIESELNPDKKTDLMEKVNRWRSALTEVADLIGLELQNHDSGSEAKFVDKIIAVIGEKLKRRTLHVAPFEIEIEPRAMRINKWVQNETTDVSVVAICGMGGIGKTTIAKYVYNQNVHSFDGSSFLADIREVSKQPNGLVYLQRQLLSDISRKKHGKISNFHEGLAKIENLVRSKRVLLVLDDVDHTDQIQGICGMQDWLFPGSKVIITTRYERMLKPHLIFRVGAFGEEESIKLLSLHAFGEVRPMQSYIELTKRVVQICLGIPLALKVIGSSLSGRSEEEWGWELEKLEAIPHNEILTKLKTSFGSLQDDHDRRLFLHIACFFVGTDKEQATQILEKCDFHAKIGIQNLIDRCLLDRDGDKVLKMHGLVQDMGREIVHQESLEPGERSRLWHQHDAFSVLNDETGTKAVEGLMIDMRQVYDETHNNSERFHTEEILNKSMFSKELKSLKKHLTSQNDVYFRTDAFTSMTKIRLLGLNYVKLTGNYSKLPKGVVWLSWHGFPLDNVPSELALKKVVSLSLRYSRLKQVWKKTPFLESLKFLDMSYSKRLRRTPNFTQLPNLERLIFKGCVSLVEVCESIENLELLELLDLSDCTALEKLSKNLQKLESLRTLIMSGCNISVFSSDAVRDMKPLQTIRQSGSIPRKGPHALWTSLPFSLRDLDLSNCNLSDDSFPHTFGNMPALYNLNLSQNQFCILPNCIKNLTGLRYLSIGDCHRLQWLDLEGFQSKLTCFGIGWCSSLKKITSIDNVTDFLEVRLSIEWDEVEGSFKSISTQLFGEDIIKNSFHHSFEDQTQIFLEFGITNYLVSRSGGFSSASSYEKGEDSLIIFQVPLHSTPLMIQSLNLFCTFNYKMEDDVREEFCVHPFYKDVYLKIKNHTKDLTWIYIPSAILTARVDKDDWEWGSRWSFGNHEFEGGDIIIAAFCPISKNVQLKECGYKVEYQEVKEENGVQKSRHDFPEFRLSTGEYILFHLYRQNPNEDYWFPKHSKRFFDLV